MAKIPEYYNVGDRSNLTVERLLRILEDLYRDLAIAVNRKPDVYFTAADGLTNATYLSNGDLNVNTSTQKVEMLTSRPTSNTVGWTTLS